MSKLYKLNNKSLKKETPKDIWEKVQEEYDGFSKDFSTEFKKEEENNSFNAIFSTEAEDRDGDIIRQNFELASFKKNPVLLDSHRYDSIEHIIGKVDKISVRNGKLKGKLTFALDNPKGKLAAKLADSGFLNATSIGFIPKDFDSDGSIKKAEILEISLVGVPSNPESLLEKSKKSVDIDAEKIIEEIKKDIDSEEDDNIYISGSTTLLNSKEEEVEEKTEKKIEEKSKKDQVKKSKKEIANDIVKDLKKKRYKDLKRINDILKDYTANVRENEDITKQEKKVVNKVVRKLLSVKKR